MGSAARHSDPKLTLAVYGRLDLRDMANEVAKLPDPPELATGSFCSRLPGQGPPLAIPA